MSHTGESESESERERSSELSPIWRADNNDRSSCSCCLSSFACARAAGGCLKLPAVRRTISPVQTLACFALLSFRLCKPNSDQLDPSSQRARQMFFSFYSSLRHTHTRELANTTYKRNFTMTTESKFSDNLKLSTTSSMSINFRPSIPAS